MSKTFDVTVKRSLAERFKPKSFVIAAVCFAKADLRLWQQALLSIAPYGHFGQ